MKKQLRISMMQVQQHSTIQYSITYTQSNVKGQQLSHVAKKLFVPYSTRRVKTNWTMVMEFQFPLLNLFKKNQQITFQIIDFSKKIGYKYISIIGVNFEYYCLLAFKLFQCTYYIRKPLVFFLIFSRSKPFLKENANCV